MTVLSPDCSDRYKHPACSGDAWDIETDGPCQCGCDCHDDLPTPLSAGRYITTTYGAVTEVAQGDDAVLLQTRSVDGASVDNYLIYSPSAARDLARALLSAAGRAETSGV